MASSNPFGQVAECPHDWNTVRNTHPGQFRWQCSRCGVIGCDCEACSDLDTWDAADPAECPSCSGTGIRTLETMDATARPLRE